MEGFQIRHINDESFDLYLNDIYICNCNHDSDGWSGMDLASAIVEMVGDILKLPVTESYEETK